MTLFHLNTAIIAAALLLAGCTQQQQSAISSSNWQRNLNESVDTFANGAQVNLEHAGNWLSTETELSNLQAAINRAIEDGSVNKSQAASLRNSLDYIDRLQERSISSAKGISTSERAQISTAVERVESRLNGWVATGSKPNM